VDTPAAIDIFQNELIGMTMTDRPRVSLHPVDASRIQELRNLNSAVLKLPYPDIFYKNITGCNAPFSRVAVSESADGTPGAVVGAICATLMDEGRTLYVMTLAVYAAHRNRGVGRKLMEFVFEAAQKIGKVQDITVHVHSADEDALRFYHHLGFSTVERIYGYYRRLEPADAFLLKKRLDNVVALDENE
jgi:ribosomal protein S18 acetylase RimI-like enzyme